MLKSLFVLLFLICSTASGQFSIKGEIEPNHDYSWILLYKMENGNQIYLDNADVVDGAFEFELSDDQPAGIYRAYYQIENSLYVEFIYNKEDVVFKFDPSKPYESLTFTVSAENEIYQEYYQSIRSSQKKIDSLQVKYFKSTDPEEDRQISENYKTSLARLKNEQKHFEEISKGKLAYHIIKASAQFNGDIPMKSPVEYLSNIKSHFFDSIDLKDSILSHSSFVNDRLTDYVFYLNQADNIEDVNVLHQEAIDNAILWIKDNYSVLKSFEEALIEEYLIEENVHMINYVIENYYNILPTEFQDEQLTNKVSATLKTAIGIKAPDFNWDDQGEVKTLYNLKGTEYYIVLFFSSNCPHCQVETPEFYEFIGGIENIKVVAIGLEDQKESWDVMTKEYHEFINILDLDKWSSQKVKDYGVSGIPSYFVLDADKNILAKPEDYEELKAMFEAR